jgi:uncharacterized membrane protein
MGSRRGSRLRKWAGAALSLICLVYLAGAFFDPPFLRPLMKLSCHRIPRRSLVFPWGTAGQCARCTGFWAGALSVSAVMLFRRVPGSLGLGLLLVIPMVADGSLQYMGMYESTNLIRLATGALAGAGLGILLGRASDSG